MTGTTGPSPLFLERPVVRDIEGHAQYSYDVARLVRQGHTKLSCSWISPFYEDPGTFGAELGYYADACVLHNALRRICPLHKGQH